MRSSSLLAIFLFSLFILESCSKKETVGLFTNADLNNLSVEYIDTFTVKTSTVAMDSLPTFDVKNDHIMLAGRYKDPLLGTVTAQSYFQVGLGGNYLDLSNQVGLIPDSLVLVLYYNSTPFSNLYGQASSTTGYFPYAGDTTKLQTLSLFRLNKDFQIYNLKNPGGGQGLPLPYFYAGLPASEYTDMFGVHRGYLFNTSRQSYDPSQPLAQASFRPYPRTVQAAPQPAATNGKNSGLALKNDSVMFKLPNSMLQEFFKGALSKDRRFQQTISASDQGGTISPDGNFLEYLKGFTIVPSSNSSAILSFDPTKSQLRFYYRSPVASSAGNLSQTYFPFPITTNPTLFNAISTDRTGTPLQGIKPFVAIPSEKTGNKSFVQAGSGLMTKIEFPYLWIFRREHPFLTVNRAELIVQTGNNSSTSQTPTIPWLTLYATDRNNAPLYVLPVDFGGPNTAQTAPVRTNPAVTEVGVYHYFLVQFTGLLLNNTYDNGTAILIGPSQKAMENSVERIALNNMYNKGNPIRLRIYYSKITNTQ